MQHELILLSPYRFPAANSLILGPEDMAAWLNGYTALWHPAIAWGAQGPPRAEAAYDHEQPRPGFVYALPESPPLYLPDDWHDRVRAVGSVAFKATPDRLATLANLKAALEVLGDAAPGWLGGIDQVGDPVHAFFGIGWGHLLLSCLAEAMEHENLLEKDFFWDQVQHAIALLAGLPYEPTVSASGYHPETAPYPTYDPAPQGENDASRIDSPHWASMPVDDRREGEPATDLNGDAMPNSGPEARATDETPPDPWQVPLMAAAAKLLAAREVLYPVRIHLLDIDVLDQQSLEQAWPAGLELGTPLNVAASGAVLEQLAAKQPEKLAVLRDAIASQRAEVCGGPYLEREDPFLPIDSQLWNLGKGLALSHELLGAEVRVFARKRFGFHPQLPLFLSTSGLSKALFLTFDDSAGVPAYTSCVVAWPSPDGKQIDAFVRAPYPAHDPQTFFNLGHYWFKTTREDHTATIGLLHTGQPDAPWYRDLMELNRLTPLLGQWTTFSSFFAEVNPGEYPQALAADDFHSDLLSERVTAHHDHPVSAFASHLRSRRRLDQCWTLAALQKSLSPGPVLAGVPEELNRWEDRLESEPGADPRGLEQLEQKIAAALADRLQVRASANQPGYMVLNPCGFARRVALELEGGAWPLPVEGQIKACQLNDRQLKVVLEIPALGFAWIPREGPVGAKPMASRLRLADLPTHTLRNEFFEVEIDSATGGLKAIRDHKTRVNRMGQRLVFNPGSRMVAKNIQVTSTGPALGEMFTEGVLIGDQEQVLAQFRQRFRLWLGRPMLEMRVEITPEQAPAGYPWHAYFGSRFAWRDERGVLLRGVNGASYITAHPRPQTPDYLELRLARQSTVIFPGGLPFHQRHEGRMLDVILIPEGEKATTFDLGIALDRDMPMQTAWGLASPVAVVPTSKGPPHIGASGWLFHLDAPNLLLTRLHPGPLEVRSDRSPSPDAVTAWLFECSGHSGLAELRCVRNPKRACLIDARGNFLLENTCNGDAVSLEVTPNDLVRLQVEFS